MLLDSSELLGAPFGIAVRVAGKVVLNAGS